MASIENMTDDEILAAKMPGERGYVLPALRDPALQPKKQITEDDLISAMDVQPSYMIGQPDIKTEDEIIQEEMEARRLAESIGRRREEEEPGMMDAASEFVSEFPSRVARGADELYPEGTQAREAFDLAAGAVKGAGQLIGSAQAAKTRALMDPETAVEEAKEFGTKIVEGDPQAQEEALVAASMSMVPGVQDAADIELARRDVKKAMETRELGDIATAGVSTVFAAIPLVGVGLGKKIMKGAPDASEIAKLDDAADVKRMDVGEPVFESVLEKSVAGLKQDKIGIDQVESELQKSARALSGEDLEVVPKQRREGVVYADDLTDSELDKILDQIKNQKENLPNLEYPFSATMGSPGGARTKNVEVIGHAGKDKVEVKLENGRTIQVPADGIYMGSKPLVAKKPQFLVDPSFERKGFAGASITDAEIESTMLREFLDDARAAGKKSVTKDELIDHLQKNKVEIQEIRLGGKGELVDPVRFEKAQVGIVDAHDGIQDSFGKLAKSLIDMRRDSMQAVRLERAERGILPEPPLPDDLSRGAIQTTFHRLRDDPMSVYDLVDRKIHDEAQMLSRLTDDFYNYTDYTFEFIQPQDAKFLGEIHTDFYEFRDIGSSPNLIDLINPESVQYYRDRLGDMIKRYGSGKGSDTQQGKEFLNQLVILDSRFGFMQQPGGLLDQRAAVKAFGESPEFQKLKEARIELSNASVGSGQSSPPKWEDYSLPGGRNYQEILLTTPDYAGTASELEYRQTRLKNQLDEVYERNTPGEEFLPGDEKLTADLENQIANNEFEIDALRKRQGGQETFYESHFSEYPNVMVHIRTTDRIDEQGRKILFVEEVQSDWHQKGRQDGYKSGVRTVGVSDEIRDAARKIDSIRAQIDELPQLRAPSEYNIGLRLANRLDDTLPSRQTGESLTDPYIDYGLDWLNSLKNKPAFEAMSDSRKDRLRQFAEFNEQRQARVPLANELKNAVGRLVDLSQGTPAPLKRDANPAYVRGDSYIQELESTIAVADRDGVPDAPFKKTEEWLGLAVRRIMREAAEKGYDGVAFTRGKDAYDIVNMPAAAADEFYNKILPSVVKRQTKGKVSKTTIGIPENPDYYSPGENVIPTAFNFIELTPKVKDRASKPQKLFEVGIGTAAGTAGVKAMRGEEVSDEET